MLRVRLCCSVRVLRVHGGFGRSVYTLKRYAKFHMYIMYILLHYGRFHGFYQIRMRSTPCVEDRADWHPALAFLPCAFLPCRVWVAEDSIPQAPM